MRCVLPRLLAAAAMVLSPATATAAGDEDDFALPTYAGAYQPQDRDERGMWAEADEHERILRDSDLVIRDGPMNDYVRGVLCRTVGEDRCTGVRTYIVRAPAFNASMAPNGTMRVFTGLLLRAQSEAELASVLGHEFAHFEQRHSLRRFQARRTGSDLLAWATVLGAAAANYGGYRHTQDVQLAVYGDLFRFSRDQEREADLLGFAYMREAGFRPAAAAHVWKALMDEDDSTAADRGRRSRRYNNVAFFASHPTQFERADTLGTLAEAVGGGTHDGHDEHRRAIAPFLTDWLAEELAMNDFGGTDYVIERLLQSQETAAAYHARGELHRQRGHPRDLVNAAGFYRRALELDRDHTESYRGLGLSLFRSGERPLGTDALRTYLELHPDASDAAMLRMMVGEN